MVSKFSCFSVKTTANTDILDITDNVLFFVQKTGIKEGMVTISVPGSTASVTTIEYESGAVEDLIRAVERIAPSDIRYEHDSKWGDGNGYAHVRAALMKASITIPIHEGKPVLGTWQQIVLLDFDNRPRNREVVIQVLGET
jgi:secondary thiamine-phosphate synthase enzyme